MKKAKFSGGCWLWMYGKNGNGYGTIGRNKKIMDAHKFMYELIVGKVPHNCELDHLCRNKLCVNPTHLEVVSHAMNCRRGNRAKLNVEKVKMIRKLSSKYSHRELSEKFGASKANIGYIIQGKRWSF